MQAVYECSIRLEHGGQTPGEKEIDSSMICTALSVILILTKEEELCKALQVPA